MELIRRRVLADAPKLATATGAVASFTTDMAVPFKSCQFAIEPVQSGSGDPSPSNVRPISGWTGCNVVRCGKNLFDESTVTFGKWTSSTGAVSDNVAGCISDIIYVSAGEYVTVWYNGVMPYSCSILEYDSSDTFIRRNHVAWVGSQNPNPLTVTIGSTTTYIKLQVYVHDLSDTMTSEILASEKVQLEFGQTPTTYAPYTGSTYSVTFPALGKNLCDGTAYSCAINNSIAYIRSLTPITSPHSTTTSYAGVGFVAKVKSGVTYALSSDVSGSESNFFCALYDTLNEATNRANAKQTATGTTFTPNSDGFLVFLRFNTASGTTVTWTYAQCEVGSTATAYEPYTNTVYGGTLDVTTGVLTVDRANIASYNGETLPSTWISDRDVYAAGTTPTTGAQVVYTLTTPLTYTLTPQQITALKGANNVWCDTGNSTVIYWKH